MTPDFSKVNDSLRIIGKSHRDRYESVPQEADAIVLRKTLDRAKKSFADDDRFRQSCDVCETDTDQFQAMLLK